MGLESCSGRRWELDDAAIVQAEGPDIDVRDRQAEGRKGSADLAPMIASVV